MCIIADKRALSAHELREKNSGCPVTIWFDMHTQHYCSFTELHVLLVCSVLYKNYIIQYLFDNPQTLKVLCGSIDFCRPSEHRLPVCHTEKPSLIDH